MTAQRLRNLSRALAARNLRVAPRVAWWERLVERTRLAERWEYVGRDGRWHRYWRRNGRVPGAAIPRPVRRSR